jgi:hypothetical protein
MLAEAKYTAPTAFNFGGPLSLAGGLNHVSIADAARRAMARVSPPQQTSLDALEAELLVAEVDWNDHADLTDEVKAEREGREVTSEDEAIWQASSDRHWAAVDALTAYVPRSPMELVRKATLLTNKGDTRLRTEEQFAELYLADARAVASFSTWAASPGHEHAPAQDSCPVLSQADQFAKSLTILGETDGEQGAGIEAACEDAWRAMIAAEAAAEEAMPTTPAGVAFQLLCAAGEIEAVENGATEQITERAMTVIRAAIANAIAVLNLPHDTKTAEYFLGAELARRIAA